MTRSNLLATRRLLVLLAAAALSVPAFAATPDAPTWSSDVAPIVQDNCQGCHRDGQIGPMPLTNYSEVRPWAKSIQKQVVQRTMPPWFAHPDSRKMKGDMNLTTLEIDTIKGWVAAGAPEGNPADLPAARKFETFDGGWVLKKPDMVLQPQAPFVVGADVIDEYRCFHVPFGLDHDVWMKGGEFQAGNPEVVHHFILFGDPTDGAKKLDDATPEPGWECGQMDSDLVRAKILKMWAPGNVQPLAKEGMGVKVPAGTELILQIHVHNTTGVEQVDHSKFALHLARPSETIQKEIRMQLVSAWTLDIKAGDKNSEHRAEWTAPADITVSSSGGHMHARGKDIGMWATRPGQERETLLWMPRYDFNWQLTYEFVEPLRAPKGTHFEMISHHDN